MKILRKVSLGSNFTGSFKKEGNWQASWLEFKTWLFSLVYFVMV